MQYLGAGHKARIASYVVGPGTTTVGMCGRRGVTGMTRPIIGTILVSASLELKRAAGWHYFDPTFIQSAYKWFYMWQKENGPRYVSRFVQKPTESLPGVPLL